MTDVGDHEQDGQEYDPYEHVPDRIDLVSASGLDQLHDALADRNKAKLRSIPIEQQAVILWDLVEKGTISLDVTSPNREADR